MRSLILLPLLPFKWLLLLPLRLISKLKLIVFSFLAGLAVAYWLQLREAHRTWGLHGTDGERELPGDDLVEGPIVTETRSLVIDAEPAAVWPWLVQMGYGRGGWYSYDQFDRPWSATGGLSGASADEILPEFQDLAEGDVVPTYKDGGFSARVVDVDRALVLYLDDELVKAQIADLAADDADLAADDEVLAADDEVPDVSSEETSTTRFPMPGAMGDKGMPAFKVSWAFVLEPEAEGRTRLIERFRGASDVTGMSWSVGAPVVGYGVFAMTRRQMLGIKERVEQAGKRAPGADSEAA